MDHGPLRIIRQPRAFGTEPTTADKIKEYWEKLARLAPAEVTGFYLTLRPAMIGNLTPQQIPNDPIAPWWPWVGVALCIFVRVWATHASGSWRPQWAAVGIATFAFILWVITMGHYMAYLSDWWLLKEPRVSIGLAAVFTFVVPYFYQGDPPPAPQQGSGQQGRAKPGGQGGANAGGGQGG